MRRLHDDYDAAVAKEGAGLITEYRRERLTRGNIDLYRDPDTVKWLLSWAPDQGEPDWPGHTYAPDDPDPPKDYPDASDVDALLAWGRKHFGP